MIHFLYVNSVCDLDSLTVTHLAEKPVYVNPGSFEGVSIASKRRLDHNNRKNVCILLIPRPSVSSRAAL